MKIRDLTRPDKLIAEGIKVLSNLGQELYSSQKTLSKAKGQLTFIGQKKLEKVLNQRYRYNEESIRKEVDLHDFHLPEGDHHNYWLNFHGIHEVETIEKVGAQFDLERLTIRQILDTTQRPKVEDYDHYLHFSIKSIMQQELGPLEVEQLSFVLGKNYVISFQEQVGDHFEGIRSKMEEGIGFIRKRKSDYLLSQLLDAILDNYFEVIDELNHEITELEKQVYKDPGKSTLIMIEAHKRSALLIRKSLLPFKDALMNIMNDRTSLIRKHNLKYFKDLSNSAVAALEETDATLKTLESLTNIYFASLSQKMNETMKVLTTVATIFIPLTFIAGIYGMNFDYMPELRYKNAYFMVWGVMVFIGILMLIYFKRKKWI